ncbi:single-stranded DNA-binding protein [Mycoplasma sp. 128]|uniref:single-stranded DNA-binding protein n=1 Tax=Mycoplasma sp. 3341 TaxID=3447506 RepID=UPI003F65E67E
MNKILLIGRLTDDPQGGKTKAGDREYARFTLAVTRRQYGPNPPLTDYISCVAFGITASSINKFLDKGALISIEGSLQVTSSIANGQRITNYSVLVDSFDFLETREIAEKRRNKTNNDNPRPSFQQTQQRVGINLENAYEMDKKQTNTSFKNESFSQDEEEHVDFDIDDFQNVFDED